MTRSNYIFLPLPIKKFNLCEQSFVKNVTGVFLILELSTSLLKYNILSAQF